VAAPEGIEAMTKLRTRSEHAMFGGALVLPVALTGGLYWWLDAHLFSFASKQIAVVLGTLGTTLLLFGESFHHTSEPRALIRRLTPLGRIAVVLAVASLSWAFFGAFAERTVALADESQVQKAFEDIEHSTDQLRNMIVEKCGNAAADQMLGAYHQQIDRLRKAIKPSR
jgi:hypothetical protein